MKFYARVLFLYCLLLIVIWILIYSFKIQNDSFKTSSRNTTWHKTFLHEASSHKAPTNESSLNKISLHQKRKNESKKITEFYRIAITCYIPSSPNEVQTFLTMLYGSWRYISNKKDEFSKTRHLVNRVNLIAFTHVDNIVILKTVCQKYNARLDKKNNDERCWYIRQDYEIDIGYDAINSFIMFNRTDIYKILEPYKYTMRTDYDVFLTPTLYTWKAKKKLVVGIGGYSVFFTRKRLKQISLKLNLTHKGVHDVGSTWFGESKLFINLSKKVLENTVLIYLNEFNPKLPGLIKIKLQENEDGIWPEWWRPVSLLYGAEVSLNHWIEDFSDLYKDNLDVSSCSNSSLWETPHIHCWHNDCEFQKFRFIDSLNEILKKNANISSSFFHRFADNVYDKDVSKMTIKEYSTFIAWNSFGKYITKIIHQQNIPASTQR
ncbi:uncharacterized protein LOC136075382 [Hydra vulgaris]|uniref:Uncharacterized protein LOC136075382 n=1 Tax=Hydra vulgaris TaxID=6087 RepID=A0ABM4B6E8_HYDVU